RHGVRTLSSEREVTAPGGRRHPLPWLRMLLVVATAVTVWLAASYLPSPWRSVADRSFDVGLGPLLAVIASLMVAWTATVILKARALRRLPLVGLEEPLLSPARLATGRPEVRVVIVAGVERGCGASTLTFNLA